MKTTIALFGLLFSAGTVIAQNPDSIPMVNINDTVPQKWSLDTSSKRMNNDTSVSNWKKDTLLAKPADTTAQNKKPEMQEKLTDRVMMKDGAMVIIKNGEEAMMEKEVVLPSGTVIKTDGTVKKKDGSETKLKDGQYIALSSPDTDKKKADKNVPIKKSTNKKSR